MLLLACAMANYSYVYGGSFRISHISVGTLQFVFLHKEEIITEQLKDISHTYLESYSHPWALEPSVTL